MTKRAIRFLLYALAAFSVLLIMVVPRSVLADPQKARLPVELTLEGSMSHDPDAVACLQRACKESPTELVEGTGSSKRELAVGACKRDHQARVARTIGRRPGEQLAGNPVNVPDPSPYKAFACSVTGSPIIATDEARLRRLEDEKIALQRKIAEEQVLAAVAPPPPSDEPPEPEEPASNPPTLAGVGSAAATGGVWGACLPPHTSWVSKDAGKMVIYVDAGADYNALPYAWCLRDYDTTPRGVIEANAVEKTIPYCKKDGKRNFDPTRYSEILSGKRKLEIGGKPNVSFLDACEKDGGDVSLALQGKQRLTLLAKAEPPAGGKAPAATPKGGTGRGKTPPGTHTKTGFTSDAPSPLLWASADRQDAKAVVRTDVPGKTAVHAVHAGTPSMPPSSSDNGDTGRFASRRQRLRWAYAMLPAATGPPAG